LFLDKRHRGKFCQPGLVVRNIKNISNNYIREQSVMLPHQDAIFIVHHHSLVFSQGRLHPNTLTSTRFSTRKLQDHAEPLRKEPATELTQLLSETTVQAVGISCWNPLASEMHHSPKSGSAQLASKDSHSEYSLDNLWLDITFVLQLPVSQRLGIHLET
jgi:hypothetical protein